MAVAGGHNVSACAPSGGCRAVSGGVITLNAEPAATADSAATAQPPGSIRQLVATALAFGRRLIGLPALA
jgi:hypothetical protein